MALDRLVARLAAQTIAYAQTTGYIRFGHYTSRRLLAENGQKQTMGRV
jgi:hypothetical protein